MPSTPAAETFNQSEQPSPSILLPWGIEDVGPMLDALDGTTLARMYLSTAKAVRQEHRMPFARSLRHALRIFCQAHNALQVSPAGGPHNEALVTNLERATKLLHITPALLQSSDGRCSRQGRYNEYARGEMTAFIDWLVAFAGRSRQKAREDTPEARRIRASKLAHQQGGITKAASALISPPAAPRDSRTLAKLRGKHPTEDPQRSQQVTRRRNDVQALHQLVSRSNSRMGHLSRWMHKARSRRWRTSSRRPR